jgi:hypothetical protein
LALQQSSRREEESMRARTQKSKNKIGRPLKNKDEVLGAFVSVCLPRPFHAQLLRDAALAGCTRPEFLRILLTVGLAAWRKGYRNDAADGAAGHAQEFAALNIPMRGHQATAKRGA